MNTSIGNSVETCNRWQLSWSAPLVNCKFSIAWNPLKLYVFWNDVDLASGEVEIPAVGFCIGLRGRCWALKWWCLFHHDGWRERNSRTLWKTCSSKRRVRKASVGHKERAEQMISELIFEITSWWRVCLSLNDCFSSKLFALPATSRPSKLHLSARYFISKVDNVAWPDLM